MPDVVGFTGIRSLRPGGEQLIRGIVAHLPAGTRVVTGACIGVDAAVARAAFVQGLSVHTIVPADRSQVDPQWERWCTTHEEMPPGTDYRARNERIVALSDRLIAFPEADEQDPRSRRSGTWQTVRLARKAGMAIEVVTISETPSTLS